MKIDTHVHSCGISKCSRIDYKGVVESKIFCGYDGAILMNHCQPWYYENNEEAFKNYIEDFIAEYKEAELYARKRSFQLFLGMEVSIQSPHWADILLYGVTESFLRSAPIFCNLTQAELYDYCKQWDVLMVQAHPLRDRHSPLELTMLDGLELNCQLGDLHTHAHIVDLAIDNNLLITCGTDFHGDPTVVNGGIVIPDGLTDSTQIKDYIKSTQGTTVFMDDKITQYFKK